MKTSKQSKNICSLGSRGAAAGAVVAAVLLASTPAQAQQHEFGAAHQFWTLPGPAWNVDTWIDPGVVADSTFFAQQLGFEHSPSCVGNPDPDCADLLYLGLQQHTGVGSRSARFSVWNSTAARGPHCEPFGNEGVGMTCFRPYPFVENHAYTLRVERLEHDGVGPWWGAHVIDGETGVATHLGDIRAPDGTGDLRSAVSFDEYFGPAVPCDRVPHSSVAFGLPTINRGGGRATFAGTQVGSCSGGVVTPTIYGTSIVELGRGCSEGSAAGALPLFAPMAVLARRRRRARPS